MEPKTGDKSICSMCGNEIEYTGRFWDHTGALRPRHPAAPLQPTETKHANAPVWAKDLSDREWSQVLHAQAYARDHIGAGAPGHGQFLLIAKLARLLDAREPHESGGA